MINLNEAKEMLLKMLAPTVDAAGFAQDSKTDSVVSYDGDLGEIRIVFEENYISVNCRKEDQSDFKEVATTLYEPESDSFNDKDNRSAALDVADTISHYFGTELVYDTDVKPGAKSKAVAQKDTASDTAVQKKKKTKKDLKKEAETFDAINLVSRLENAFPEDLKGKADELIDTYGEFLPEEYFNAYASELVLNAVRTKNKAQIKRIFKTFNTFYDEGEKDMQSLITVSVLGVNFAKEPELYENCKDFMSEDLDAAVSKITEYLQKSGKKKIKELDNPVPYTEPLKLKAKNVWRRLIGTDVKSASYQELLAAQKTNKKK